MAGLARLEYVREDRYYCPNFKRALLIYLHKAQEKLEWQEKNIQLSRLSGFFLKNFIYSLRYFKRTRLSANEMVYNCSLCI